MYDPNDPDLLKNRSIPERAAVISAGVIANIIFAYFALLVQVGAQAGAIRVGAGRRVKGGWKMVRGTAGKEEWGALL